MPSVLDLVRCAAHGYFERSAKVAEKYGASRFVYGSTFTRLMRCLNTRSVSTVKRLVNEAVEAGLVKPIDVGVFGRRIVYRPTLRGVVHVAVEVNFFSCTRLAVWVVREAVKRLEGFEDSCNDASSGKEACFCLKYELLKLVERVFNGDDVGLWEVNIDIADAFFFFLFGRLGDLLVTRYASLIINDAGDPIREAVEKYRNWVSRRRSSEEWCREKLNALQNWLNQHT